MLVATFAERLKQAMEYRNIKASEIVRRSEKLFEDGKISKTLKKPILSDYLKGRYEAKQDNVYTLALILDVDEAWLMGADTKMERTQNDQKNILMTFSMTDASMYPLLDVGDIAFINPQETFKSGDTIYFRLEDKLLIRKIIQTEQYVEFKAMNPYFPTLKYTLKELNEKGFAIIGRVIKIENKSAFK